MPTPRQQIDAWKARLLDLSRRNRMLHTRPGVSGTVALSFPDAFKLCDALVRRRRRLAFATPLTLEERLAVLRWDTPATGDTVRLDRIGAPLPKEGQLATDLAPDEQERTLYALRLRSRTALNEGGVNILFVALGFLEWFDRDAPELVMRSPLLLVPVELIREKGGAEYALRPLDDDLALNPTLAHKLRQDYGIELPALPDDPDELNLDQLFAAIDALVSPHDGWRVQPESTLGLFSFLKLMLYNDLERAAEIAPTHPVLSLLTSSELKIENAKLKNSDESAVSNGGSTASAQADNALSQFSIFNSQLDLRPPDGTFQILDADGSQREAIEAARSGGSFVLQGPPGTGKSQTIANIIAEALAQGQRVLFVSEKMAALDVVYERLRQCGLAEFCLELHSHKASKRAVLDTLGAALDAPPASSRPTFPYGELAAVREQLNAYARALHTPRGPLSWTVYAVHSRIALFADAPECEQPDRTALELSPEQFGAAEALLARLDARRALLAHMPENVWRGCALTSGTFEARGRIRARLRALLAALAETIASVQTARWAVSLAEIRALAALAALLREPHAAPAIWLADSAPGTHLARRALLDDARERFAALAADEKRLLERYTPAVLELDLDALAARWRDYAGWTRLLRPGYHRDAALLRNTLAPGATQENPADDIALARAVRDAKKWEAANAPPLAAQLGPLFAGRTTNWPTLAAHAEWFARVRALLLPWPLPETIAEAITNPAARPTLLADLGPIEVALHKLDAELAFLDELKLPNSYLQKDALAATPFSILSSQFSILLERMADLDEWWELCELRRAAEPLGLAPFLDEIAGATPHPASAAPRRSFHKRLCQLWLDAAYEQLPPLRAFGREHHEALVARFRELDAAQLSATQSRLRHLLAARRPPATTPAMAGELATLRRELAKQRRHKPIRQLFGEIPALLGQLKPCLLMSPLSVSQFLAPDAPPFDLLIFDEASQIRTEDAVGAVMRARATVVVGDNRQLPPTSFFLADADEPEDEDADETPDRFESILDACAAAGLQSRMLRWHYRSRHESLIAFSNASFYNGRLATFPSATMREGQGVRFEHVPEGRYDRRASRANRLEAQHVADLVWRHLQTTPAQSLGVVAFSQAQQLAILHELETRRAADASLETLFDEGRPEPFFVKNLENVQGDERDAVIVSVGYGRDEAGKLFMHFGPLNQQGGERRLNVAITRARERLTLVSSILPEEIDLRRTQHPGPRLLRAFLEYARRGGPEPAPPQTAPQVSAGALPQRFEDQLAAALAAEGLALRREVGHSDFRIDIAISDPADTERYILGVECDGDDYRDAPTARDRERLREQVLEGLGWRIHRAWSAAWAVDAEGEIGRVLENVKRKT